MLVDDLGKAYTEERAGAAASCSPSAIELRRLRALAARRWSPAKRASGTGQYWRQQLARPLPVLDLPTDFARPAIQSYQGAVKHFYLDPTLTRAIVALGESRGASLYTILLAAFQVFLGRYSGQDDILVGSPVAGRTRPGFEGLVGYFVNLAADAGRPLGEPDVSTNTWAAFAGPSPKVWSIKTSPSACSSIGSRGIPIPAGRRCSRSCSPTRRAQRLDDQGLAPFALGIPGARLDLHGLAVESIAFERQTALFDLTMMTARDGDRLCVALEYSTDLFKSSTIDRMADGFRNLLEAIVADPGRRLADLALLLGLGAASTARRVGRGTGDSPRGRRHPSSLRETSRALARRGRTGLR